MTTTLLLQMMAAALVGAAVAVGATPLVKTLAVRAGVVRVPRARDVHDKPTPLWGGLAIVAGFMVALAVMRVVTAHEMTVAVGRGQHPVWGILIGASLIAVVGLLDDKYDLSPKWQAGALLAGGLIAALLGARIEGVTNPFVPLPTDHHPYNSHNFVSLGYFSVPITMAWGFLIAKTVDFLDGLDGLAAGVCAIAALTIGLMAAMRGDVAVALMAGALLGGALGFLRYNYNPASIFMGTSGAQFMGFILAMLAVVGTFKIPATLSLIVPLLVLGVPVFDGLYVIGRRLYLRQTPQVADTTHIHHRFRKRGLSVRGAVWSIYALTMCGCAVALVLAWLSAH